MSETARRNIELTVQVNIDLARRALKQVEEDAAKSAVAVGESSQKAARAEIKAASDTAAATKQIMAQARLTSRLMSKEEAREAREVSAAKVKAAKEAADATKQIMAQARLTSQLMAREEIREAREVAAAKAKAARDAAAASKQAMAQARFTSQLMAREEARAAKEEKARLAEAQKGYITLNGTLKAMGVTYTGLYAVNTTLNWAKQGAQVAALDKSYMHIGFTAKDLDATMEKLGYTLDKATVQRMSNLAHSFNFGQKEIQRFAEIARAASVKTGQDIKWMFESIVTGTARQSRLILDNLGILVSVGAANEKYAKSLGTTVDKLTDQQKKQAFVNEVMLQGQKIINDAPLDPLSQKIGRVASAWTEAGNAAKVYFANVAGGVIEAATGKYATDNLSRGSQSQHTQNMRMAAAMALRGNGAFGEEGLHTYADRDRLEAMLELAGATEAFSNKMRELIKDDKDGARFAQVRAEAQDELLQMLEGTAKAHQKNLDIETRARSAAKDTLKDLATEQDLRMKVDELKGSGLDKQEQETLSLKSAVDELNEFIRLRTEYNNLVRQGIRAISPKTAPGDGASSRDTGAAAPWAPTGRGLPQDKDNAFINDPLSPGHPSGAGADNYGGQLGVGVASPAESADQSQGQEQTKKREGRSRKDRRGDIWLPTPIWGADPEGAALFERDVVVQTRIETTFDKETKQWLSVLGPDSFVEGGGTERKFSIDMVGGRADFSEFELAADKVKDVYAKVREDAAEMETDLSTAYKEELLIAVERSYEKNKKQLEYAQEQIDAKGLDSGWGAFRDKAMGRLTGEDKADFLEKRRSRWQEGASDASFAWANFAENAEPDRLKAISDAIGENIAKPADIAAESLANLANGFAETAAAAFYEAKGLDAWKRATNEMLRQLSRQAAAKALFEGAAALGSLAVGDIPSATLHGKAAAAYAATAVITGVGAALTGGLRTPDTAEKRTADKGGPAPRTKDDAKTQAVYQNTYYISYSGLSNDADVRRMLVDVLNGGVGSGERIDSRMVELR